MNFLDRSSPSSPPQLIKLIKRILVNNQIRALQVRVIDETGKQLGIMPLTEAIRAAQDRGLDLIQVTEKVEPAVCKIGNYGKYLYREEKREKAMQKNRGGDLKGIRITFNISPHDLETRAKQTAKFLNKGDVVRVELPLRGRQKALQEFAKEKIAQFLEILKTLTPIKIERDLKKESRGFSIIIGKG